ncbi:MAG: ABC transporter ATP-binding protein [Candidatus Gracilibacteria bacterium]|nr:ABC transporter ATP-binding protein [Candidatus Gracilibacteria bacterium]
MKLNIFKKVFATYVETVGKTNVIFVFLFCMFVSFVTVIEPLFFSEIIKKIEEFYKTGTYDYNSIIITMLAWAIFIVVTIILLYILRYYIVDILAFKNYKNVFLKYVQNVFDMHYGLYLGKKSGSIYKNFDRGVEVHFLLIFEFFNNIIKSIFSISIIIVILFIIDWKMASIALSMLPFMILFGMYFNNVTAEKQKLLNERWDAIYGVVGDSMSNFLLFKTLSLEKIFYNKLNILMNEIYNDQLKVSKQWSISDIYTAVLIMISRLLVLGFGMYFLLKGQIDFYTLFVVFSYLGWIYFPLGAIFSMLKKLQENILAVERFYKEFDEIKQDLNNDLGKKVLKIKGNISFQDVKFAYINEKNVLNGVSFEIKQGTKNAFVGNTGSGKSTIINLILRFWDVNKGIITIDGININDISKSSIRDHIGIVTQDNSLFNLSILENLRFAKPKATLKEVKQALIDAQADFVFTLENGLDTVIGERGLKLSGGEKQRISLARLFLKNPEILILDEATSALDNKTEKLIQKALDKLMKGRTSIVIAHRLSTIQNSDNIFVLENGKIVESGNYDELMNNKSKFYNLANPEHLIIN